MNMFPLIVKTRPSKGRQIGRRQFWPRPYFSLHQSSSIRILIFGLLWLSVVSCFSGDIVDIKTPILVSHFSQKIKQPLYVSYALYRGGGDCERGGMGFRNDLPEIKTATAADYARSGYDKGHLANAEDFAYDCEKQRMTFLYYNALPQTPNLNRGIWKSAETTTRKASQKDRLFIVCGGYSFHKRGLLYVPAKCFKVVKSISTGRILLCTVFTNTDMARQEDTTVTQLERTLGYQLPGKALVGVGMDLQLRRWSILVRAPLFQPELTEMNSFSGWSWASE